MQSVCAYARHSFIIDMLVPPKERDELTVVDYLRNITDFPPFIHNKPLAKKDCPYRPDMLFYLVNLLTGLTWALIVEGDENQHRGYKTDDARMLVIAQALGMPVHFIRFNMDEYKDADADPNATLQERMEMLTARIRKYVETAPTPPAHAHIVGIHISVEYMFYDVSDEPRTVWSDLTCLNMLLGCDKCGLDFGTRGAYLRHCRTTCGIRPDAVGTGVACTHCNTMFASRSSLMRHDREPSGACAVLRQSHTCKVCCTLCESASALVEHTVRHHPAAEEELRERVNALEHELKHSIARADQLEVELSDAHQVNALQLQTLSQERESHMRTLLRHTDMIERMLLCTEWERRIGSLENTLNELVRKRRK